MASKKKPDAPAECVAVDNTPAEVQTSAPDAPELVPPAPVAPEVELVRLRAELASERSRRRNAEAALRELQAAHPEAPPPPAKHPSGSKGRWQVSPASGPAKVVDAEDAAEALHVYGRSYGLERDAKGNLPAVAPLE